jgi:hypothetical protein
VSSPGDEQIYAPPSAFADEGSALQRKSIAGGGDGGFAHSEMITFVNHNGRFTAFSFERMTLFAFHPSPFN